MSATPHTKSWFANTSPQTALGTPTANAATPTAGTARARATPKSTTTRDVSSTIEMSDESAANVSARKNATASTPPNGISAKSRGIQINVSPVEAGPDVRMTSRTSAEPIWLPRTANTIPNTIVAASSDTRLLPTPVSTAFRTTPSSRRM